MKALLAMVLVTLFALASCSSGQTTTTPAPGDSGGNNTTSSDHQGTCLATCTTAADCGMVSDPLYDASHFACNAGRCDWLGCKAASECTAAANGGTFVCRAPAGAAVPVCIPGCQTAADCVPPGGSNALDDAGHFACNGGACVWLGCVSTAECSAAFHTGSVACEMPAGASVKTCVPTCATASDCAAMSAVPPPLNDASHYVCKASRCEWLGCKSTAECDTALQSTRYVCE